MVALLLSTLSSMLKLPHSNEFMKFNKVFESCFVENLFPFDLSKKSLVPHLDFSLSVLSETGAVT